MAKQALKLPEGEVGDILHHIQENLAFRPLLTRGRSQAEDRRFLPPLAAWETRLRDLRELGAPLFVPKGRGPAAWLRRALNVPLKVFGRRQAHFNEQALDLLTDMVRELHHTVTRQSQILASLSREVGQLKEQAARGQDSGPSAT